MMSRMLVILAFLSFFIGQSFADMPAPRPPQSNPNPPKTAEDIKRVEFAQEAIKIFFQGPINLPKTQRETFGAAFKDKDSSCIKNPECYHQDLRFMDEVKSLHRDHGVITEIVFPHIIPWSFENFQEGNGHQFNKKSKMKSNSMHVAPPVLKADEYMIHSYVKFSEHNQAWYHFNVIMSEDKNGQLKLRHFYTTAIPSEGKLPPGVKC